MMQTVIHSTSIRRRLIAGVLAIQALTAGVAIYLVVAHERAQSYLAFDAHLREQAAVIHSLVEVSEGKQETYILHKEFMTLPADERFALFTSRGPAVEASPGWVEVAVDRSADGSILARTVGDTRYRALVLNRLMVLDVEADEAEGDDVKSATAKAAEGKAPIRPPATLTILYAAPVAPLEQATRHLALEASAICLLILLISGVGSTWLLARGLRPLEELAQSAAGVDIARWNLPGLDRAKRFSELRPLADALEQMLARLHAAFAREQQFFGDAAHEMKSSIAIVRSTVEYALQTDRSAVAYKAELTAALADTTRLQNLVASMLALVRIESSLLHVVHQDLAATEVNAQMQRVVERFTVLATQHGVQLVYATLLAAAWVSMTEDDLHTVLSNLVENAIVYSNVAGTPPLSIVTLDARLVAGRLHLQVIDEGCGMAADVLNRIFERFYRGDPSRARATGGVGLGLSIARALVVKAGGTIAVHSAPGQGSRFTINLPLAPPSQLQSI